MYKILNDGFVPLGFSPYAEGSVGGKECDELHFGDAVCPIELDGVQFSRIDQIVYVVGGVARGCRHVLDR